MAVIEHGVKGIFTVTLKDGSGNTKWTSQFENMITDGGLDLYAHVQISDTAAPPYLFAYCELGTGTAAPQPTDTDLTGKATFGWGNGGGNVNIQQRTNVNVSPRYNFILAEYSIQPGYLTGTWSEIGIRSISSSALGSPTPASRLLSRTLIKDAQGNPTSITKEAGDYLYITYEFRQYIPEGDVTGQFVLDGVTYDYTIRPFAVSNTANFRSWAWPHAPKSFYMYHNTAVGGYEKAVLQPITATSIPANGGASANGPTVTSDLAAYTGYRDYVDSFIKLEPGMCNFPTGISLLFVQGYQFAFTPSLPKAITNAIHINIRNRLVRL